MWLGKVRVKGPAVEMVSFSVEGATSADVVAGKYTLRNDEVFNIYVSTAQGLVALQSQIQKNVLVYLPISFFDEALVEYADYTAKVAAKGGRVSSTVNGFESVFWNEDPMPVVIAE